MRPNEVARAAQKSEGSRKSGGKEKAAAIKVGKDSGRVKVFVRVRPLKSQEVAKKEKVAVDVSELSSSIHVSDPKHSYEKDFPFDHVFPSGSTNHEVCNTLCKPIVTSALNGFNGTLMAYGQTGSGKTYTLMAPDGIAAGVVDRCFKRIMHDAKHDYKVSMSYLQIYQEKIYDLLNSTNKVDLNIREHPQKGVYVENLSEFVVRTPSEVMNLLAVGKKRLVFAETKMNRTSSRSHSVCMLLIERTLSKEEEGKPKDCVPNEKKSPSKEPRANSLLRRTGSPKKTLATSSSISETPSEAEEEDEQDSLAKMTFTDDVLVRGRIHLCDLAGSERLKKTGAEGERLSEAQHINLSLLELGNVIHALADGSKTHVPFRNSTLTRLLQESLGGNCKTSLIVCVSPTMTDVSETKSTLYFGSRAMKITNTAYVNVEVDYKKLSDDLTKILNTRDKDLEDLKESYESRIEKVKMEAESQINSSMLSAQEVLSSVRSLFDSKEQELKNELQQVDEELQREKQLSSELREHLSSLGGCLSGGVNRTKSALLAELLSMQLFYALQGMPEQEREHLAREMQGEYLYSGEKLLGVREKVLENTDNVLQILECYLKQQNREGLENSGLNLRDLETALMNGDQIHSRVPIESSGLNSEHRELSWNKTDDDKVMESDKCHNNDQESNKSKFLNLTKQLRSKLVGIKDSLDGDAIEFLKKAFALDGDNNEDRKKVYNAMVEFLLHRKSHEDKTHDSSSVTMLNTEMALLDQSLCHVIVDKALQSSILLLEQSEVQRRCTQLSENNRNLNKELEVMRLQVETLVVENNKLNSKLSETSNFLQDVKSSREMLENDLSSVFQLYNMRSPEHKLNNGGLTKDASSDLKDGLSTLVEENAKLKLELKDTQEEKRDLQMQLKKAKEKLQKLSKELETKNIPSFSSKSTQTDNLSSLNNKNTENHSGKVLNCEEKNSKENPVQLSNGENQESQGDGDDETSKKKAVSKKLVDIEQFLINVQDELIKLEDDESALFSHANQRQLVSSLRLNLNKRLGELWSIEVVESKTLRARVDELTIKLESAAFDYEKQIEELESELHNESQARLNLENELLQYRKEVMDLGEEIWKMCHKESEVKDAPNIEKASSVTKYAKNVPQDEVDSRRRLSSSSLSLSRCNSDDSLPEVSKRKVDLRLAEIDAKRAKEEFEDLKHSFLQLNRDLANSGKARQEMEEKFVKLANENNAITLRFQAAEDNNKALEEKIGHVSALKTTLQDELIKLKEAEHSHMEDIRGYKEKIANYEVEKTRLKHDLSKTEIQFTTLDNKYKEMNSDLIEAKKCLKEAQMRLKTKEQEVKDLHEAYDRLRSHIVPDDSDRESLVEVKMKQNGRRDSATPSRIQSIHLVSRAKSPSTKKKQPMYLAAKKKMSIKRSPRNDENSPRKSTLKRGTLGKRETLTSDGESRTFTRGESDRDTIKRSKGHEKRTLKRNNDEDQKLKSELLLAKEQLLRLKGELTLSNIQTANLGTHLTSLREDSNKLEVELSSLRRPPGSKEDPRIFEGNKHAISELDSAKEKIIGLQDDILALRRETSAGEEKLTKCEEEANQLRSELYKTRDGLERSQEVVKILNKEIELLETKNQILQHRLTAYACKESETHIAEKDGMPSGGESSINTVKLAQFEQDKARLEKEVEQLSNEKTKLEDMQNLVQQLVEIEDEQALLKSRLRKAVKKAAKNDEIEEKTINPNNENDKPSRKVKSSQISNKVPDQNTEKKLEEYYVENTALRCEVDALRIYISNLENENKTVKFKLSISESSQSNTDKKVLATLLASAKHEREELRETLNGVYSEKEDMEEALNVARIKSERLQRELMQVSQSRTQLEKELHSLKNDMQIPEKEKTPSTSLTMEEKSIVDLVRKFLNTVGLRNVKERDIKDFARTLLARKIHLNGKNPKPMGMDSRQTWKSSSSIHRNSIRRDSPGNSSKAEAATVNRTGMLTNISPAKTTDSSKANSTSGLRRYKPGTDRGTPEGMEVQHQSTTAKSKHDIKIFNSTAKIDNLQSRRPSKEVKDDLSLIYLDIDSKGDTAADSEVLIKRAWSLKDLFKRNSSNGKAQKNPSVINQ